MGAVGIWGMHFIGNLAIKMGQGQPELQIRYSPGFTFGAFFTPIFVLSIAFYRFGTAKSVTHWGTLLGGTLTGLAVCAMHYISQLGLANYSTSYFKGYVVGSVIVAIITNTVVLSVFFYLRVTWTDTWLKRLFTASAMAASVSAMHWVATIGCAYRFTTVDIARAGSVISLSRQSTALVIVCMVHIPRAFMVEEADNTSRLAAA